MTEVVTGEVVSVEARQESFEINGRTIPVKGFDALNEGQVLGMMKVFTRYLAGTADGKLLLKLDHALSQLLDPEDNDWLDWQVMEGNVKYAEVLDKILPCLRRETVVVVPVKQRKARRRAA